MLVVRRIIEFHGVGRHNFRSGLARRGGELEPRGGSSPLPRSEVLDGFVFVSVICWNKDNFAQSSTKKCTRL